MLIIEYYWAVHTCILIYKIPNIVIREDTVSIIAQTAGSHRILLVVCY